LIREIHGLSIEPVFFFPIRYFFSFVYDDAKMDLLVSHRRLTPLISLTSDHNPLGPDIRIYITQKCIETEIPRASETVG